MQLSFITICVLRLLFIFFFVDLPLLLCFIWYMFEIIEAVKSI